MLMDRLPRAFGGNIPVWLGTVRPIPVGAVLEAEFIVDKALYRAGTPVQYNAEARTFKPLTPDAVAGANGYLYNDIYIDSVADTDVNNAATGAIVMHHGEGLLIDRTDLLMLRILFRRISQVYFSFQAFNLRRKE